MIKPFSFILWNFRHSFYFGLFQNSSYMEKYRPNSFSKTCVVFLHSWSLIITIVFGAISLFINKPFYSKFTLTIFSKHLDFQLITFSFGSLPHIWLYFLDRLLSFLFHRSSIKPDPLQVCQKGTDNMQKNPGKHRHRSKNKPLSLGTEIPCWGRWSILICVSVFIWTACGWLEDLGISFAVSLLIRLVLYVCFSVCLYVCSSLVCK